ADAPALLAATRASLVIVDERLGLDDGALQQHAQLDAVIFSPNARLSFIRALEQCFAPARPQGIHAQAVIEPGAVIGERVYIGPFCSISREAVIGDDVV